MARFIIIWEDAQEWGIEEECEDLNTALFDKDALIEEAQNRKINKRYTVFKEVTEKDF